MGLTCDWELIQKEDLTKRDINTQGALLEWGLNGAEEEKNPSQQETLHGFLGQDSTVQKGVHCFDCTCPRKRLMLQP